MTTIYAIGGVEVILKIVKRDRAKCGHSALTDTTYDTNGWKWPVFMVGYPFDSP